MDAARDRAHPGIRPMTEHGGTCACPDCHRERRRAQLAHLHEPPTAKLGDSEPLTYTPQPIPERGREPSEPLRSVSIPLDINGDLKR